MDRSNFGNYVFKRMRIMASEDVGLGDPMVCVQVRSLYENWQDQRKLKDTKHEPEHLYLIHAVLVLVRAQKSRMVDHALMCFYAHSDSTHGDNVVRPLPEYAFDKHTQRGRREGKGFEHFFDEASRLEHQSVLADPYRDRARAAMVGKPPEPGGEQEELGV